MKKQNINIGDKLLCKDNLYEIFKKYKYYYVDNVIDFSTDNSEYFYDIRTEYDTILPFFQEEYLYTYFYRKNEVRKKKLEKINEEAKY